MRRFLLLPFFLMLTANLLRAQPGEDVLYYYSEDSIMRSMPEYRLKEDSLRRYLLLADSTAIAMGKLYSIAKREVDSIRKTNGGCYARCHHPKDSAEIISSYRELVLQEVLLIDSILTQRIRDTIQVYVRMAAAQKKYPEVVNTSQFKLSSLEDRYVSRYVDVTDEIIEEMRCRRK